MIRMVRTKLEKFGILSVAKFTAIYGVLIGLLIGIFMAVLSSMVTNVLGAQIGVSFFTGYLAIITYPLVYGIGGFIMGIISALLFNLIAKMSGGIEMHFKELE